MTKYPTTQMAKYANQWYTFGTTASTAAQQTQQWAQTYAATQYTTTSSGNFNQWYITPQVQPSSVSYRTRRIAVPPGQSYVDIIETDYDGRYPADYRRPPPREFNKYLNGSDLLEEFIKFVGDEGVRSSEFMGLPVELFVKWLIVRACEQDQEEPNVTLEIPARPRQPRCLGCGRFMHRAQVPLHERCAPRYFARSRHERRLELTR